MPFWLPYDLQRHASSAVLISYKYGRLEGQVECIRNLSELKVGPVLVNQPAHLGFLISLNSFMYPDREI